MVDPIDVLKAIPKEVAIKSYEDALQPALRQFGEFAEDTAKTLRLALFPIKGTAYLYDKLSNKLVKAIDKVPNDKLVPPSNNFILPIVDRLLLNPDDSVISDLYIKLLSSGMNKDKVKLTHPAFFNIIGQLSPDEALLISILASQPLSLYFKKIGGDAIVTNDEIQVHLQRIEKQYFGKINSQKTAIHPEQFQFGSNLFIYIDHLQSLGLLEYVNNPYPEYQFDQSSLTPGYQFWFVRLSLFGKMFYDACVGT